MLKVITTSTIFRKGRLMPSSTVLHLNERAAKELIDKKLAKEYDNIKTVSTAGKDYFCVASGGSLTKKDCALVEEWRKEDPKNRGVIVTNNTYKLISNADVLVALDKNWWGVYKPKFKGAKFSATKFGDVEKLPFYSNNSGLGALLLARHLGAKNIYLLGYDLKETRGKKHWHEDHPKGLFNAENMNNWVDMFSAKKITDANVINCTKSTALNIYTKKTLKEVLDAYNNK